MNAEVFFDTNVLVYAADHGAKHESKRKRALELIRSAKFGTSAQVLQEFYVTLVRKGASPLSPAEALEWIDQLAQRPCKEIDHHLVRIAIEISARYRISYWDGAIIAAAKALGATLVYSEDLNDGQNYGEVRVINPFR